jgi:hypothetical protein
MLTRSPLKSQLGTSLNKEQCRTVNLTTGVPHTVKSTCQQEEVSNHESKVRLTSSERKVRPHSAPVISEEITICPACSEDYDPSNEDCIQCCVVNGGTNLVPSYEGRTFHM